MQYISFTRLKRTSNEMNWTHNSFYELCQSNVIHNYSMCILKTTSTNLLKRKSISNPTDRRENLPIFLQRQSSLSARSYKIHKTGSPEVHINSVNRTIIRHTHKNTKIRTNEHLRTNINITDEQASSMSGEGQFLSLFTTAS